MTMDDFLKVIEELADPAPTAAVEEEIKALEEQKQEVQPQPKKPKKNAKSDVSQEPKRHVRISRPMAKPVPAPRRGGKSIG